MGLTMDVAKLMDDDSFGLDSETIHILESFLQSLTENKDFITMTVEPVDANRYKGDLIGLLTNVFKIPNSATYLNMRINGFKSTLDYDGERQIKILESSKVEAILDIINERKTMKEELLK